MDIDVEQLKKMTPEQQAQVLQGIKQQAALASAQGLIAELSEKCSVKCVSSPGSSLSSGEKQCLQRCLDRFMESWNLISTTLQKRLQEEAVKGGAAYQNSFS
ncbi:hypothetical protein WR25_00156 [Diploscapter pachys]|uniref:Mitochondrial import inner membrane translocase subunit n=1 Tax=Diploscapter pachys TaxID=2018661 RepID=A0A2A2JLY2_9BILA|nr:hypothetical protein WR25_00156 [Diploscapter pachys]